MWLSFRCQQWPDRTCGKSTQISQPRQLFWRNMSNILSHTDQNTKGKVQTTTYDIECLPESQLYSFLKLEVNATDVIDAMLFMVTIAYLRSAPKGLTQRERKLYQPLLLFQRCRNDHCKLKGKTQFRY